MNIGAVRRTSRKPKVTASRMIITTAPTHAYIHLNPPSRLNARTVKSSQPEAIKNKTLRLANGGRPHILIFLRR